MRWIDFSLVNISTASPPTATRTEGVENPPHFVALMSHTAASRNSLGKGGVKFNLTTGGLSATTGSALQPWLCPTLAWEANAGKPQKQSLKLMSAHWLEATLFANVPAVMRFVNKGCLIMREPAASSKASLAG